MNPNLHCRPPVTKCLPSLPGELTTARVGDQDSPQCVASDEIQHKQIIFTSIYNFLPSQPCCLLRGGVHDEACIHSVSFSFSQRYFFELFCSTSVFQISGMIYGLCRLSTSPQNCGVNISLLWTRFMTAS
ncbi:unnamed protein product [Choristocarpus tenellus]